MNLSPHAGPAGRQTLVAGGRGYIGSAVADHLSARGFGVTTLDTDWFPSGVELQPHTKGAWVGNVADLADELASFDNVILLAGHSSVGMCQADPAGAVVNNVANFVHVLGLLKSHQRFVFASSASVYGSCGVSAQRESGPLPPPANLYDATKRHIEDYAALSGKWYAGLRFGTVSGPSRNLRLDVVINSMSHAARSAGVIKVGNPQTSRPILGMLDLCRAMECLLITDGPPGIYNWSSFNTRVADLAEEVHNFYPKVQALPYETPNHYDMTMDCSKFSREYGYEFGETPQSILKSLEEAGNLGPGSVRTEEAMRCLLKSMNATAAADRGSKAI